MAALRDGGRWIVLPVDTLYHPGAFKCACVCVCVSVTATHSLTHGSHIQTLYLYSENRHSAPFLFPHCYVVGVFFRLAPTAVFL